uniref:NAD-dependent epimerase/dehydratase domain-containing protein n=1 Tax=Dunaliella tertiolecta TaxID=3047 RepID=A0A7S3RA08_DUNTE|mmetsp:Transcript_13139/g.35763  ORF Transcript_13139/g.35763 Transcript_13139/m.35763 type:complete len:359 (+) Transcript_13139:55-1131(+)
MQASMLRKPALRTAGMRRPTVSRKPAVQVQASVDSKKILMMGGTRFIGLYLARQLVEQGHDVTLFTRGKKAVTSQIPDDTPESFREFASKVHHISGDRQDFEDAKSKINKEGFQIVYDINGREAEESQAILEGTKSTLEQFIYCSSAGVYLKSDQMPHREEDATDLKSRHKGKLHTEKMLAESGIPFTSIRPVYIYGPLNYNPVEEWFFHRIAAGRPVPVPSSGIQVTQLGHVKDLAAAFTKCLGNKKAYNQIYNISGPKYVTFDGIAKACAIAMGKPEPELVHFNPKDFDFGKAKAFPLRDQHFFTSIDKAMTDLDWKPEFGLIEGLTDSYTKDFGRGTFRKPADFTTDDMILSKLK